MHDLVQVSKLATKIISMIFLFDSSIPSVLCYLGQGGAGSSAHAIQCKIENSQIKLIGLKRFGNHHHLYGLNAEQLKILELASMQQQQRRIITHCPTLLSLHSGHQKNKKKNKKKYLKFA